MGNTCKSMADSCQCMTKPTTIKKKNVSSCKPEDFCFLTTQLNSIYLESDNSRHRDNEISYENES